MTNISSVWQLSDVLTVAVGCKVGVRVGRRVGFVVGDAVGVAVGCSHKQQT